MLETASKDARVRAVQMHFEVASIIFPALSCNHPQSESHQVPFASVVPQALEDDEYNRVWMYDTGAGVCSIGKDHLTASERARTYKVVPESFITAAGITSPDDAVLCNISYLGIRECRVMHDCSPLISVSDDVNNYNSVFVYSKATGPYVALADGTMVYLDDSRNYVPEIFGSCSAKYAQPNQGTETSWMPDTSTFMCSPCDSQLV